MRTISHTTFTTVKTEGAILPADLLQRIAAGQGLDGLRPDDYHLASNERLNEAINRSWNRCLGAWASFNEQRARLPESDFGTTLTRERWLLILFQELGYGRLQIARGVQVEGTSYPISHLWGNAPIHLVSFRQDLDRRDGARIGRSPHSLVQEYLNRAPDSLWGFVSNGLRLRVLRDNVSLTRAAYVEFDLEVMLSGELYADFCLLWLIGHQSRVEGEPASECWLERWSKEAAEQGARALDTLRDGVQEAIAALGRGFLAHPANRDLKAKLKSGELMAQNYYRQLLRLVYRLIFLFVAEDRDLLLVRDPKGLGKPLGSAYMEYYSAHRLRQMAEAMRGGPHADLYRGLRLLFVLLREGYPALRLPALGGFLFSERATPDLANAELPNSALLEGIRALAFTIEGKVRRPVDYKNLGSVELGSVYESLLELHPVLNTDAATFDMTTGAGNERKTTGSHYTHPALVNELIESALEPVITERLDRVTRGRGDTGTPDRQVALSEREQAILSIKVTDPACGSGHFLVAAGYRLARRLATVRTGDDEPSPEAIRSALRDVVGHCLYGVDINPMAVELCKVSLWLETLEPGKPLSFLDHHIQCGNSLIGATPALLARGIPDEAFKPIEGDDKKVCTEFKKRNKNERQGARSLFDAAMQPWERLGDFAASMTALDDMADDTLEGVRHKQERYEELVRSSSYEYGHLLADAWCAAFVWKKTKEFPYPITEEVFRQIERNPFNLAPWMREEIKRLQEQYQFFHWHLAFPDVFQPKTSEVLEPLDVCGWVGGFDCVLGNPPWERVKLEEEEFFATRDPRIAQASGAEHNRLIRELPQQNQDLWQGYQQALRSAHALNNYLHYSGRFHLDSRGDINTYTVFSELCADLIEASGRVGIIVPTGIATDDLNKLFFARLVDAQRIVCLYDFENREAIFSGIHRSYRFCLLTLRGTSDAAAVDSRFAFFLTRVEHLRDRDRVFVLSSRDIELFNPNTRTCPVFRTKVDVELTRKVYEVVPVLVNEANGQNPWGVTVRRAFDMNSPESLRACIPANELASDHQMQQLGLVPLYEAKMIWQFDHRAGTYKNLQHRIGTRLPAVTTDEHDDPSIVIQPWYWVPEDEVETRLEGWNHKWLIGYRDITNATNERTMVATVLPFSGTDKTIRLVFSQAGNRLLACLLSNLDALVFDYVARQFTSGLHLSRYIVQQLPILPPSVYTSADVEFVFMRALELVYNAWNLKPFAEDCGYDGPPFRWDENRRILMRCELDATYFHLYGIARDDVDYIMETFPIVKRKDEAAHGEYRTKRVILEIYDAMQRASESGQLYQTLLDPPPADPRVAHPAR